MGQFASWVDEQHPDAAESLRVGLYELFTRSPTGSGRCPALCTIARIRPVACSVPRSMIGGAFGAAGVRAEPPELARGQLLDPPALGLKPSRLPPGQVTRG